MKELDIEGVFWPAAKPDERVAGRLRFDVSTGAELHLIGSFGGLEGILLVRLNLPSRGASEATTLWKARLGKGVTSGCTRQSLRPSTT